MDPKEAREIIKSEVRVYMRMITELDLEMNHKTTVHKLKLIAARYGIAGRVVKMLIETGIIVGITDEGKVYELKYEQEFTPYNFLFTEKISYRMADALRLWRIYQIHIQAYIKFDQTNVLADLNAEDKKMKHHCLNCGEAMTSHRATKKYCCVSCRVLAYQKRKHRMGLHKCRIVPKKKQNWWKRFLAWVRSIGKKSNYHIAA